VIRYLPDRTVRVLPLSFLEVHEADVWLDFPADGVNQTER
jgi:hypothetical protein